MENKTRPKAKKSMEHAPDFHCPIFSANDPVAVAIAAEVMKKGGVVVYPTETAYALGCNGLDKKAVGRIYAIKHRDRTKPLPVIMASAKMVSQFVSSTLAERVLVRKFMPGPLTIAAKKKAPIAASGNAKTVAFRIPANEFARNLSARLGAPIVSTSANLSGESAIYEIAEAVDLFSKKADLIIDAGNLAQAPVSTIVCLLGKPKILRQGAIAQEEIMGELKKNGKNAKKSTGNQ